MQKNVSVCFECMILKVHKHMTKLVTEMNEAAFKQRRGSQSGCENGRSESSELVRVSFGHNHMSTVGCGGTDQDKNMQKYHQ